MIDIFWWNLFFLVLFSLVAGFFAETGERWLAMQIVFYLGLSASIVFWLFVAAVKVGTGQWQ